MKGSLYVPQFNTQLDLQAGRYLYGDYGLRGDCTRHFGEYAVGVYAMYVEGEVNGGFHFAIPLPGKKWNRNHAVRMPPNIAWCRGASMPIGKWDIPIRHDRQKTGAADSFSRNIYGIS